MNVLEGGLASWSWFQYGHYSIIHPCLKFWFSIFIFKVQRTSMSFKSWFGFWWGLKVPDWGLPSWSWFRYGHLSLIHPWPKFCLSILILRVQRSSMSFKSWFVALEDTGGSWLGFGILIFTWIWSKPLLGPSPKFWSCSDQWKLRYKVSVSLESVQLS